MDVLGNKEARVVSAVKAMVPEKVLIIDQAIQMHGAAGLLNGHLASCTLTCDTFVDGLTRFTIWL